MGDLKRISESLESNSKKKVCQHEGENVQETAEHMFLQTSAEDAGQFNLSLLPNEILLKIYDYLSPVDLISLVKVNDKRLAELTYTVRRANFSECRMADPAFVPLFFSRDRVKLIQKINFNHYFYLKPQELTSFICRCKNLKSLSVVGCKLNFTHIYHILQNCRQLEKLALDIMAVPEQDISCFSSVKKLHVYLEYQNDHALKIPFMKVFPNVKHIWINFEYDCNISVLPFVGMWSTVNTVSDVEKYKYLMIAANKSMYVSPDRISNKFVLNLQQVMKQLFVGRQFMDLFGPENPTYSTVSVPPYLQFQSDIRVVESMTSSPPGACSTLVIDVTDEVTDVPEGLIKCVQEIAGKKLEHLSFVVSEFERKEHFEVSFTSHVEYIFNCDKICDILEPIFLTSKYITVLNLTTVHFSIKSPIAAIALLKYLKVLNLPSCAFSSNYRKNEVNLSSLVPACTEIKEFVLYCCPESASVLTSDDLVCMQNWSQLEHLSVIYSTVLRSFAFLQKVAYYCVRLSSLTLLALPSHSASIFTYDVIYLLRCAKNLRFIRINDVNFNPMFERFWPAVGEALNLEGICITTTSRVLVNTRVVVAQIKKLKYLHLFHFDANVPQCFFKEVKKSMQAQGIQNIRCEEKCILPSIRDITCHFPPVHIYHQRPYTSECFRLHLKDFDFF